MPRLEFVTLDVFTKERYAGNPLAVVKVPEGVEVSTEVMQKIARYVQCTLCMAKSRSGSWRDSFARKLEEEKIYMWRLTSLPPSSSPTS